VTQAFCSALKVVFLLCKYILEIYSAARTVISAVVPNGLNTAQLLTLSRRRKAEQRNKTARRQDCSQEDGRLFSKRTQTCCFSVTDQIFFNDPKKLKSIWSKYVRKRKMAEGFWAISNKWWNSLVAKKTVTQTTAKMQSQSNWKLHRRAKRHFRRESVCHFRRNSRRRQRNKLVEKPQRSLACVHCQQPGPDQGRHGLARFGKQRRHAEKHRGRRLVPLVSHEVLVDQVGNHQIEEFAGAFRENAIAAQIAKFFSFSILMFVGLSEVSEEQCLTWRSAISISPTSSFYILLKKKQVIRHRLLMPVSSHRNLV